MKERTWPRDTRSGEAADGRYRLALDIRISPEVVAWLLGYGASAEVVGPA